MLNLYNVLDTIFLICLAGYVWLATLSISPNHFTIVVAIIITVNLICMLPRRIWWQGDNK